MTVTLIGRSEEHGAVRAFLRDILEGPAALVLAGEPGIGKTVVWTASLEEATQDVGQVLSHRGLEAEATLSFECGAESLTGPAHCHQEMIGGDFPGQVNLFLDGTVTELTYGGGVSC